MQAAGRSRSSLSFRWRRCHVRRIDILVDMGPGRSLLDLGGLVSDLQELLGRKVDVVTERGLKPRIRARVLGEAVLL